MIYIDPPYNTGKDFVYPDDFHDSLENYKKLTGQVDSEGNIISTNTEASGRYHTDWLNMMYPRLRLARNLLSDDGAIFIHIDEHEVYNMQKICMEVFGEDNELGTIIWDKRNPKGSVVGVAYQHESILIYCKDKSAFAAVPFSKNKENALDMITKVNSLIKEAGSVNEQVRTKYKNWLKEQKAILSGGESAYNLIDEYGNIYQTVSMAAPDKPETRSHRPLIHPITGRPCPTPAKGWRYIDNTMDELIANNKIEFGVDETTQPRQKYLLKDNLEEAVSSLIYFGGSDDALGLPFENPKPTYIAWKLIQSVCKNSDDIILDFFSGSSTTAHAVMQLNDQDGGNRKFIMVQLPETTDEKSEAYKAGYMNICEIGKERIRRAGEKIKEQKGLEAQYLDIGFKVLKLDTSNIRKWQPNYDNLEQSILDYVDNYVDGRTELDVVYEIMIKYGLDLTYPVDEFTIANKKVYSIGFGMLMICLDNEITTEVAKGILEKVKELAPESTRVLFKDNGFKTDSNKTNVKEILKCGGIEEFITL